jgi:hypothetical protein
MPGPGADEPRAELRSTDEQAYKAISRVEMTGPTSSYAGITHVGDSVQRRRSATQPAIALASEPVPASVTDYVIARERLRAMGALGWLAIPAAVAAAHARGAGTAAPESPRLSRGPPLRSADAPARSGDRLARRQHR